jgi:hypothetical protein
MVCFLLGHDLVQQTNADAIPPRDSGEDELDRFRDASSHRSYGTFSVLIRRRRFNAVLHAWLQQANAGGSICKRRFGTDDE